MRERLTAWTASAVLAGLVALSFAFACRQNPPSSIVGAEPPAPTVPAPPIGDVDAGRAVFEREGCRTCHSLEGAGNPRAPLDGVGSRLSSARIRDWIVADAAVADSLPASTARRKRRYTELPSAALDALVAYLSASRVDRTGGR